MMQATMFDNMLNILLKIGRVLRPVYLGLGALVLVTYVISPFYIFPEAEPFRGENIHNPYEEVGPDTWLKGNFQVQSRVWGGITNGRKNTSEAIYQVYQDLGYDVIGISDYMHINTWAKDSADWFPMYEHGIGIKKNHQICMGSEKVNWLDYPFPQHIHQKQHILDVLRPNNELVCIAHPKLLNAYSPADLAKLSGYDCIEVLNNFRESVVHWDSALSAGRIVYIMANDDAHDITKPHEVGRYCTMVSSEKDGAKIVTAMKEGRAYGVRLPRGEGMSFEEKYAAAEHMPLLKGLEVEDGKVTVRVSDTADFSFIGQGGELKHSIGNRKEATYTFSADDSYIRAEVAFSDGTRFFLNPVFRHSGATPVREQARINPLLTWGFRSLVLAGLLTLILWNPVKQFRRKRTLSPLPIRKMLTGLLQG